MLDTMLGGEVSAFVLANIGDEILQVAVFKRFERRSCLFLQGLTDGTLRVVDLNDGGDAVTDLGQIRFIDTRAHFRDDIPADEAHSCEEEGTLSELAEEVPSADASLGGRGAWLLPGSASISLVCFSFS